MSNTDMYNGGNSQERKELTIKFSRKLARLFTGKDGKEYAAIAIPNADSDIHGSLHRIFIHRPQCGLVYPGIVVRQTHVEAEGRRTAYCPGHPASGASLDGCVEQDSCVPVGSRPPVM